MNTYRLAPQPGQTHVEVLYEDLRRDVRIERRAALDDALVRLFEATLWGSAGFRYTILDVADAIHQLNQPHFLYLIDDGQLAAVAVRVRKTLCIADKRFDAFHLAALAVDPRKVGQGYGKLLTDCSRHYYLKALGQPGIVYGYIEAGHTRSLNLNRKAGYQALGGFEARIVSGLQLRDDVDVCRVEHGDKHLIAKMLDEQYQDHVRPDFESSLKIADYYVLKEGDHIVAGIQVAPAQVDIQRLPGLYGALMVNMRHVFSKVSRSAWQWNYRFLRFGNLYLHERHEPQACRLMQALLARHRVRSGVLFMDSRSPNYRRLVKARCFGAVNSLVRVSFEAIADFSGVPTNEANTISQRPFCISPEEVL
jgi:GNAT superfamily N-acetyltransferase